MGSHGIEGGFARGHDEPRSNGDARFAPRVTKYPVLNARNAGERDDNMRAEIGGGLRGTAFRPIIPGGEHHAGGPPHPGRHRPAFRPRAPPRPPREPPPPPRAPP